MKLDIVLLKNVNLVITLSNIGAAYGAGCRIAALKNDKGYPYFVYHGNVMGSSPFSFPSDISDSSFSNKYFNEIGDVINCALNNLDHLYYYGESGELYDVNDNLAHIQRAFSVMLNSKFSELNKNAIESYFDVSINGKIGYLKPKGVHVKKILYEDPKKLKTFLRNNNVII